MREEEIRERRYKKEGVRGRGEGRNWERGRGGREERVRGDEVRGSEGMRA